MLQSILTETMFSKVAIWSFKIIVIIILFTWVLKRIILTKNAINNSSIKVLERISIGSNVSIVVLDVKEMRLVIGVTSTNISILYKLPPVIEKGKQGLSIKSADIENIKKDLSHVFGIKQ
ncbi:MAG: flagellar biosynthetic protein FliO [Buchnera aphidicola (Melaphis rhois)]